MAKRAEAQTYIVEQIRKLVPNTKNAEKWEAHLSGMSDNEFKTFMLGLKDGSRQLTIEDPNYASIVYGSVDFTDRKRRLLKHLKEIGGKPFTKLLVNPGNGLPKFKTNEEYLTYPIQVRRQSQLLVKKSSIPTSATKLDYMTDQVTGEHKGASLSYPELRNLVAHNLQNTRRELVRTRGGDKMAAKRMSRAIDTKGTFNLNEVNTEASRAKASVTLKHILKAMHLDSNI